MPYKVTFDARAVARLMDHAISAPGHNCTWGQLLEEGARRLNTTPDAVPVERWDELTAAVDADSFDPGPHLELVKDAGIYLLSNGLPDLAMGDPGRVVYALGFDPDRDGDVGERSDRVAGGDDLVETLSIGERDARWAREVLGGDRPDARFEIEFDGDMIVIMRS
jgi:hypothetical protein